MEDVLTREGGADCMSAGERDDSWRTWIGTKNILAVRGTKIQIFSKKYYFFSGVSPSG